MGELLRRRHGTVPTKPGVQIAGKIVDFDSYPGILEKHRQTVMGRLSVRSTIDDELLRKAAKAMYCGRILKPDLGSPGCYERAIYCRQKRLCIPCYTIARRWAIDRLLDDTPDFIGSRLVHMVFASPKPYTPAEELLWVNTAKLAKSAIRMSITAWNRWTSGIDSINAYALGIHAKASPDTQLLWTHIHLCLLVDENCRITGNDSIEQQMKVAYRSVIGDYPQPLVMTTDHGIITPDNQFRFGRDQVKVSHAVNQLAYVTRYTEDKGKDTPESVARRDQLFEAVELKSSHTISRRTSRGNVLKKSQMPHEFCPERLGCKNLRVVLYSGDYDERPANQIAKTKKQLFSEGLSMLKKQFHISYNQSRS
jgi:hypothetical protein